ncbi:hypothetical protein FHS16_002020 [Paenibacillus endophyticus]|uniref:Tissue inhibitor of metalloproteinase n=1 Tax=Paenibacillus endophyticus TaxID=1294268 RepID=A0A7W5G9B8_9BACL|nr:hypothetical protein [Paenibacillus endophyticus]MBB3151974.1 hypothetical protein [Paenibacillus endophyticus]
MIIKKRSIIVGIAAIIIAVSVFTAPRSALACSCVEPGSVQETMKRSDTVFEGTAISVKSITSDIFRSSGSRIKASFQVNEVWKGHVAPHIEVLTAGSEESCGYSFKEGERYLVYARATGSSLEASLCSGTLLHHEAEEHIALLGSGSLPPHPSSEAQQQNDTSPRSIVIASIAAVLAAAIVFALARSRKRLKSKT